MFDSMSQRDFTVSPIPFLLLSRNCQTGTSSTQISWNGSEQQTGEKKNIPVSTSVHLALMFTQKHLSRDARKTEDKTFVAAPFQPVEPGTEWERSVQHFSFSIFFHILNFFYFSLCQIGLADEIHFFPGWPSCATSTRKARKT